MPQLPADLTTAAEKVGLKVTKILHRTDKTLLAAGTFAEQQAIIKYLLDPDPFWSAKWGHEARVYQIFADSPPPVRAPRLLYTDNTRLLVLEWLEGQRLDDERYPQRTLSCEEIDKVLGCVNDFNRWTAPPGALEIIFDYLDRFNRYNAKGYLSDGDRDALAKLFDIAGPPDQVNHGDPLPSNILLAPAAGAALLDWEFTGLFLPGFDLAMLHTLLGAHTPQVKQRIHDTIAEAGTEHAFIINQAVVLTRELRIHHELSDGPLRDLRLPLVEAAWNQARDRLHTLASGRRRCTSP